MVLPKNELYIVLKWFKIILYSLGFQLVLLNLRKHILLLFIWIFLLIIYTKNYGVKIGVPILFLCPEYMNVVDGWSFFIAGCGWGGLYIVWNITVYLLHNSRFELLSYVREPFTHFVVNNFILPLIVLCVFFYQSFCYQYEMEMMEVSRILWHLWCYVIGILCVVFLSWLYFLFFQSRIKRDAPEFSSLFENIEEEQEVHWTEIKYYLNPRFKFRKVKKYLGEPPLMQDIFRKNSIYSIVILVIGLLSILMLSFFVDYPHLQIPACTSAYLVLAIICSFIGVFGYFLKKWSTFFLILTMLILNLISYYFPFAPNHALYGLDYSTMSKTDIATLYEKTSTEKQIADRKIQLEILDNWKAKTGESKPKLVMICSSGGGLSSAYWTLLNIQYIDSLTRGKLMDRNALLTGSSGGMIALGYYRSLYHEDIKKNTFSRIQKTYTENLVKDVLNAVMFTFCTNDIFGIRHHITIDGIRYVKDRGYAWEKKLNENTDYILDHPLSYYAQDEYEGYLPQLIFSPLSINDGRRVLISNQPMTILCRPFDTISDITYKPDGIDMQTIFATNKPEKILLTSAMRASATFPYVMPNINLPSTRHNELMDAGMRDNYGMNLLLQYMYVMQDWINANTSGVVVVQLRNSKSDLEVREYSDNSLFKRLNNPLSHVMANLDEIPDYQDDYNMSYVRNYIDVPITYESLDYIPQKSNQKASMSFRLNNSEKRDIEKAMLIDRNIVGRNRIIEALRK